MILEHNTTNVQFQYIDTVKPQFSSITFVRLLNLKTNRIEQFDKSTYLKYFTQK